MVGQLGARVRSRDAALAHGQGERQRPLVGQVRAQRGRRGLPRVDLAREGVRDLRRDVAAGRFRDDLFARINLWSYAPPGLAQRPEDLEPNVDWLLARAVAESGRAVRFNVEAKTRYLRFAQSPDAAWSGNFRDLSASVTRLATLADGGRISTALVDAEIARLQWLWERKPAAGAAAVDLAALVDADTLDGIDLFDRLQLESVIRTCRECATLSDAGRRLFDRSREKRSVVNDADRLREYLPKFGLSWEQLRPGA